MAKLVTIRVTPQELELLIEGVGQAEENAIRSLEEYNQSDRLKHLELVPGDIDPYEKGMEKYIAQCQNLCEKLHSSQHDMVTAEREIVL